MSLSIKRGVDFTAVAPAIVAALPGIVRVYATFGADVVITSARDGKHMQGSLHYSGRAIDLRTRTVPEDRRLALAQALRRELGDDYDVVLESDHIHLEHDPEPRGRSPGPSCRLT